MVHPACQVVLTALLTALLAQTAPAAPSPAPPLVDVDTEAIVTPRFLGVGVQWDAHEWFDLTDAQFDRILKRIDVLRPGIVRCMAQSYWYCLGFDGGHPEYVWEQVDASGKPLVGADGTPVDRHGRPIAHNRKRLEKLYRVLDACQRRGIAVVFGEWGPPANGGWVYPPADLLRGPDLHIGLDDPRFTRMAADFVRHLVIDRHYTCIRYYNLCNEVNLWADRGAWTRAIRGLHDRFRDVGLDRRVTIVGPDAGYWKDLWYTETMSDLAREVGVYDFHWYVSARSLWTGAVEEHMRLLCAFGQLAHAGRPLILGEMAVRDGDTGDNQTLVRTPWYGAAMAAALLQCTRAGVAATIAWSLDDAIHINGPIPLDYRPHSDTRLKVWGMWDSIGRAMGHPEDESPRPWYYAWTLVSRALPPGCRIVRVSGPRVPGLAATAGVTPAGSHADIGVAIANGSSAPRVVRVRCRTAVAGARLHRYVYSNGATPLAGDGAPAPGPALDAGLLRGGLVVTVPANGVVTLAFDGARATSARGRSRGRLHIVDTLDSLSSVFAHSPALGLDGYACHPNTVSSDAVPDAAPFAGDRTRVHRAADDRSAFLTYRLGASVTDFRIGAYVAARSAVPVRVVVSADNRHWHPVAVHTLQACAAARGCRFALLGPARALPTGCPFLRVEMPAVGPWAGTQIGYVEVGAKRLPAPELTDVEEPTIVETVGFRPPLPRTVRAYRNHELPIEVPVVWSVPRNARWDLPGITRVRGRLARSAAPVIARIRMVAELVDPMDDWSRVRWRSANMREDRSNGSLLGGDEGRFCRTNLADGAIVYAFRGLRSFGVMAAIYGGGDPGSVVAARVSVNGKRWTAMPMSAAVAGVANGGWQRWVLAPTSALPVGCRFLRLTLSGSPAEWTPQLMQATLSTHEIPRKGHR